MSQFEFIQSEWSDVYHSALRAETLTNVDPRASVFYARRSLEIAVRWMYQSDITLALPYQDNLSALIHEPTFITTTGNARFAKAKLITRLGNDAVHSSRPVTSKDAVSALRELFHFCYWLAHTYAKTIPPAGLTFDPAKLPPATAPVPKQTLEQLQKLETDNKEKDVKLATLLTDKQSLSDEIKKLQAEIAEVKKANSAKPDTHNYSEAQTRTDIIDLLLKEAGWNLDQPRDREFPVEGMANNKGIGFVDYVLWGDDSLPLAVIEAKKTTVDPTVGKTQAELYADCLKEKYGRPPIVFYTNGYEHWMWDKEMYPPREVQGFFKKEELEQMIQRRTTRKNLGEAEINTQIVERYYQTRAIRRIAETIEKDKQRKALVVMATGAGKTRTVIALCDLLMKCNWVKRVLFLADRVALVNQAVNAFKKFLPDASPVNLVTEKDQTGRVYVSTYPTMMNLIDDSTDTERRFGSGHFDLIIVDEAHRSVYQKYKSIFGYFDSLLVGLTATPKEDIDHDTYGLFDVETGVPTDSYTLNDAVKDGFLVPAKPVSVPLTFQREGIEYDKLSEEEKEQWDALEWNDEEGNIPTRVEAEAVNKWLFNVDTVDKVLKDLMTRGQKVAGGDRLGKTIIFAKNQDHAKFICKRFDANYPHLKGEFAQVITFETKYAQNLIDKFSHPEKMPHIAISVDMLDTGIDVPEVVNLVFFKLVRSKTKFWQMVGRGTRLSKDLFGPGRDKKFFYIFDYCGNLEFFGQNPPDNDPSGSDSLSKRLFKNRLELINTLEKRTGQTQIELEQAIRDETITLLHNQVSAMNLDNFVVRPHRRLIEKYRDAKAWKQLDAGAFDELYRHVAGLPNELPSEDEEAKRFDLLMLNTQLAVLKAEPWFARLMKQAVSLMGALEESSGIPMVKEQLPLIQEMQTEEWWKDVTVPILENARKRLRLLIKLIVKQKRDPLYTNFEDQLGDATEVALPGFEAAYDQEKFIAKARVFLRDHQDNPAIAKLRTIKPLTHQDMEELEAIFIHNNLASPNQLKAAAKDGLPLFVRSLVGLDREAANKAMSSFIANKTFNANQIDFLKLIVDHLVEYGMIERSRLFESPFTDYSPSGPGNLFNQSQLNELLAAMDQANAIPITMD